MPARFFAPDADTPGGRVALPADEAAHLLRVLRLGPGDAVRVFNGRGGEFDARIEEVARGRVTVAVCRTVAPAAEPRTAVTVAQAVLKADKMDEVIRDAVMLGASAIQPIVSTRSETSLAVLERSGRQSRWQRIAIASCKQCGRATLPVIHAPCTFETFGSLPPVAGPTLMFVEPHASNAMPLHAVAGPRPPEAAVVLGPEGGWTAQEIEAGAEGWRLTTLRLPTIRADTMATVALSALLATWGDI